MSKLYRFNPGINTFEDHRDGKVFYAGKVYQEEERRPHFTETELQIRFEYLGEGPPECGEIDTVAKLAKKVEFVRNWINSPLARKLGWDPTARSLVAPVIRELMIVAARLGRPEKPSTELRNEIDALIMLNGISKWAGAEESATPVGSPRSAQFAFRHAGGPIANDVCGSYVVLDSEGEELLLCFQRFKESKRMEKLGDSSYVEPPPFFLLPGVSIRLAQTMPSEVDGNDIADKGWVFTQAGVDALHELVKVTADLRRNPFETVLKLKRQCPVVPKLVQEPDLDTRMLDQILIGNTALEWDLDTQAKDQILIGQMMAICGEANQIFRPFTMFDHGIDGEVEFKDKEGKASGKRIYIQLKSGNSYLRTRKSDGNEVFDVKEDRHLKYWVNQPVDVYLVIRQRDEGASDGTIRWMKGRQEAVCDTDQGQLTQGKPTRTPPPV